MFTLKDYITASYGASTHKKTLLLKQAKKDVAKTKNQFIFLQRCVKNKLIPKSLRIKSPVNTFRSKKIVEWQIVGIFIQEKDGHSMKYLQNSKNMMKICFNLLSVH